MIKAHAYAKVNITFEVLGRRDDGYHDIASVLQQIDLKDTLVFESAYSISIECEDESLRSPDNLVLKAARLLQKEFACKDGARIVLKKGIPVAAGLGGGSSDAAATLLALNKLWKLKLTLESLAELAAQLGSDVPYFIHGGTALAEGRGEKITRLPPLPQSWVVLLKPAVPVLDSKTRAMYGALRPSHYTGGRFAKRMASAIGGGFRKGLPPAYNTFDAVAFEMYEGMEWYWKQFLSAGAPEVHLAGAGPTLFTLLADRDEARVLHRSLLELGLETYLVKTVARA